MPGSTKLLFFDDVQLWAKHNLVRKVGRPELVPEGTFVDPHTDLSFSYPTVFPNAEGGGWRCLYQGLLPGGSNAAGTPIVVAGRSHFAACVADSVDGISWTVPDLSRSVRIKERHLPHQVEPAAWDSFGEWGPCYYDELAEDPAERIKGFVCKGHGTGTGVKDSWVVTSPDGLTWRGDLDSPRWHPYGSDPTVSAYWSRHRNAYVLAIRPNNGGRRIAVMETPDWKEFSRVELALSADALDPDLAEIYGMPSFPYGGMYIGLVWLYRVAPLSDQYGKFYAGQIDCQLAYSYDGWHWNRSLRDSFIPNSPPGEPGAGCILPSSMVVTEDEVRFYSCSSRLEHAVFSEELGLKQGAMLMHRMRLDGFVYLECPGGASYLKTRAMLVEGEALSFNVQAPDGEMKVEVTDVAGDPIEGYTFDDCTPCSLDSTSWEPAWKDGLRFEALKGRAVQLGISLRGGRLYSIGGDFQMLTAKEGMRYVQFGTPPDPKNW